jgi:hypothetical protein
VAKINQITGIKITSNNISGVINHNVSGVISQVPESVYDADASAYFARMAVQPNDATKVLIDTFIKGCKTDLTWDELDQYCFYFLHTEQASLLDIKGNINHTTVNSPTWAIKTGFTVGARSYIRSHFIPSSSGTKFTLNNCGIYRDIVIADVDGFEGVWDTMSNIMIDIGNAAYSSYNRINNSTYFTELWVNGFNVLSRVNATTVITRTGGVETTQSNNSSGLPTLEYFIGAFSPNGDFSCNGNLYRSYGFGSSMTLTKRAAFEARLATLYAAIQTAF